MLLMFAWTLMTAMMVMNASSKDCPLLDDSNPLKRRCLWNNAICGKSVSGKCTSLCNCRNGQKCSMNSTHTITVVPYYINGVPVKKRYYTCMDVAELGQCSSTQEALYSLIYEETELKNAKVYCECRSPKVYLRLFTPKRYICRRAEPRTG
uniref:Conotoxin n=1 Tax=Conus praecellens TaxID=128530 RepID=A0A291C2T4_CONPC|nr:conotoxin [Conus praecellens]ATF27772.1 conotoxin [Conus praecellens]